MLLKKMQESCRLKREKLEKMAELVPNGSPLKHTLDAIELMEGVGELVEGGSKLLPRIEKVAHQLSKIFWPYASCYVVKLSAHEEPIDCDAPEKPKK